MRLEEYRAMLAAAMPEDELQDLVIDLARRRGWLTYHTHDSRRSFAGFPDLTMVRGGRLIFAELKSAKGRQTQEQARWAAALVMVPGVEVYLWRPEEWFNGRIAEVLAGEVAT